MTATVVRTNPATALPAPRVSVVIAVDMAYVAAKASDGEISQGVFMIDNMVRNGSTGEGTMQLTTVCNAGDLIGFHSVPIDGQGSSGDKVLINSFADIRGMYSPAPAIQSSNRPSATIPEEHTGSGRPWKPAPRSIRSRSR